MNGMDGLLGGPRSVDGQRHIQPGTGRGVKTKVSGAVKRSLDQQQNEVETNLRGCSRIDNLDNQRHAVVGTGNHVNDIREFSNESVTKMLDKPYKKMQVAVENWQVSEAEQKVRQKLSWVFKPFCGRVSTVTPLLIASRSVEEMDECFEYSGKTPESPLRLAVSRGVIKKAADPGADWKSNVVWQFFNNKDEAVVSYQKNKELLDKAGMWQRELGRQNISDVSNVLEGEKKDIFYFKAIWNVYSRVACNMALTVGVVSSILYVRSSGSRR